MGTLILVRHGQSQWNLENRFTGWTDVPLSEAGAKDAELCGASLKDIAIDLAFVSRLQRCQKTLDAILAAQKNKNIPTIADSALNERHYGDLQGLNKAETIKEYGEQKVHEWRRSFSVRPPNGESHEDCVRRVLPFLHQYILPEVYAGKTVVVSAHGNSLRPIYMEFDKLSEEQMATMEIPLCVPFIYMFDGKKVTGKTKHEVPGMSEKGTVNIK